MNKLTMTAFFAAVGISLFLFRQNLSLRQNVSIPIAYAQATETIPTGIVVAFDLATCPPGWSEFTAVRGRSVIGTNPIAAGGISVRTLGQTGGAEVHTLTTAEMPSHSHPGAATFDPPGVAGATINTSGPMTGTGFGVLTSQSGLRWAIGGIANTGGNVAHNNMQPFIALLYCEKD